MHLIYLLLAEATFVYEYNSNLIALQGICLPTDQIRHRPPHL